MQLTTYTINNLQVVEIITDDVLIQTAEDGVQLLAELYHQGFDLILIHAKQLAPSFFELRSGLAGEVLQKCSNYHIRLTIIGDFSSFSSKSLQDFIFESNKGKLVNFLGSLDEAFAKA